MTPQDSSNCPDPSYLTFSASSAPPSNNRVEDINRGLAATFESPQNPVRSRTWTRVVPAPHPGIPDTLDGAPKVVGRNQPRRRTGRQQPERVGSVNDRSRSSTPSSTTTSPSCGAATTTEGEEAASPEAESEYGAQRRRKEKKVR
ncbi:uncharacterized protein LOC120417917 [Culex pipiens pallens]|uniref:uncharacterized protein LOC120417917 n=1 Tax=Culex pipiens pallens TaxID=42434 RepID=UPI001952A6A5|nr:uncharacterized protein LOC120417917 [Culex pipiens pallens]